MSARMPRGAPRVLLVWPGTDGPAAGNFGVPQLVGLATYARDKAGAEVDVVDLACERMLGPVSLPALFAGPDGKGYDIIGFSCYASYDWLKIELLARTARTLWPKALICTGGYHASARPAELLGDATVFDAVVIGEGEKPLAQLVASVAGGAPLRGVILGPDPILDLDAELPVTDWSFLARYRHVARRFASQAQLYLSRGCPFDCAFCMERAKREVSWRAFSVERAMVEMKRLDDFLDLTSWTLYIADALFGMRSGWRKAFLERLAADPVRAEKLWLLIRVDMVDDEDLRLFRGANCGLGFGLESGDPALLAIARKAGRLDTYLERMKDVAARARELDVPWGANVICGHPGETEGSMRRSAAYLRDLFHDPRGTTGFLSVDPFRLYPGSPIDAERGAYEARHGTVFHRPTWWDDGDQEFLSEWVDPSSELDYRTRVALQTELLGPVLGGISERFVYRGKARDYFQRAIDDQVEQLSAPVRLHYADRYYAWNRYLGRRAQAEEEVPGDVDLAAVCMEERRKRIAGVLARADVAPESEMGLALGRALTQVARERFVPIDRVAESTRDEAVPLDATGLASVSAMHAYAHAFSAAGIGPGTRVVDLGCGTGYGAALLAELIGAEGRVRGVELDPRLADRARQLLAHLPHVEVRTGSALHEGAWPAREEGFTVAVFGFALGALPEIASRALGHCAVVVAPMMGDDGQQQLMRFELREGAWVTRALGSVLYVRARDESELPPLPLPAPAVAVAPRQRGRRSLSIAR